MWKFLKNLFKKKPKLNNVSFYYDNNTTVNAKKDIDETWEVEISSNKELKEIDIKAILNQLRNLLRKRK